MTQPLRVADLTRILVAIVLLGLLLLGCFVVLRPFLPGMLWGSMITVASWPLLLRVQDLCRGRRGWATAIMLLLLVAVIVVPLSLSIVTLVQHGGEMLDWVADLRSDAWSVPPKWLAELPQVGPQLATEWARLFAKGLGQDDGSFGATLASHGREVTGWLLSQAGGIGSVLLHFAITLIAAGGLFLHGEQAAKFLRRLAERLAGERGVALVKLAGESIRAVAMGIVITALVQSLLGGLGLLIGGVPFVGVLTSLMLILCVAQIGPTPVLVPAAIWLFWQGDTWQGVVLVVFAAVAVSLDNVLRPMLIQRGANLPLLLILVGVIGGLLGFGLVGLFIGPAILAMTYTVVLAWVHDRIPARSVAVPSQDEVTPV